MILIDLCEGAYYVATWSNDCAQGQIRQIIANSYHKQ